MMILNMKTISDKSLHKGVPEGRNAVMLGPWEDFAICPCKLTGCFHSPSHNVTMAMLACVLC